MLPDRDQVVAAWVSRLKPSLRRRLLAALQEVDPKHGLLPFLSPA